MGISESMNKIMGISESIGLKQVVSKFGHENQTNQTFQKKKRWLDEIRNRKRLGPERAKRRGMREKVEEEIGAVKEDDDASTT